MKLPDVKSGAEGKSEYLLPNRKELFGLARIESIDPAAGYLRSLGEEHLTVTPGDQGVLIWDHELELRIPAIPVEVIDITAARDAFGITYAADLTKDTIRRRSSTWETLPARWL